jgi:hypothetical protein
MAWLSIEACVLYILCRRQAPLDRMAKDVEARVSGDHIKALSEAYAVVASLKYQGNGS